MIERDEIVPILLEACPSFERDWLEHVEDYGSDLIYPALGSFAHHLLRLHVVGQVDCFSAVGGAIERLLVEGSPFTKEAATIGILEGIQNVWSHSETDPASFLPYLQDVALKQWHSLNGFWAGKIPCVGYQRPVGS